MKTLRSNRPGRGSPSGPAFILDSHRLVDDASNGVRCLPAHPLSGVGVGVQGERRPCMAQNAGQGLDIHAAGQSVGGEGMAQIMESKVRQSRPLQNDFRPFIGRAWAGWLFRFQRIWEDPLGQGRLFRSRRSSTVLGGRMMVRVPAAVLVSQGVSLPPFSSWMLRRILRVPSASLKSVH